MQLILFRHGPAGRRDPDRWADDSVRPLTASGARLTRNVAEGLRRIKPDIDHVVCSPLARTRQTASVLASVLGTGEVEELDALRPGAPVADLLEFLAARVSDRGVVLVGHEPALGALATVLLFGTSADLPLKKAGACSIRFEGAPREHAGRLDWWMPPKLLRHAPKRKHSQ